MSHHVNVVVFTETGKQCLRNFAVGLLPNLDNFFMTLLVGHKTAAEHLCNFAYFLICFFKISLLCIGDLHIGYGNGKRAACRELEAKALDIVKHFCGLCCGVLVDAAVDYLTELFFARKEIYLVFKAVFGLCSVNKTYILRDYLVKDNSARGSLHNAAFGSTVLVYKGTAHLYACMQRDNMVVVSQKCLVFVKEYLAFALFAFFFKCQIVDTEYHIL